MSLDSSARARGHAAWLLLTGLGVSMAGTEAEASVLADEGEPAHAWQDDVLAQSAPVHHAEAARKESMQKNRTTETAADGELNEEEREDAEAPRVAPVLDPATQQRRVRDEQNAKATTPDARERLRPEKGARPGSLR